MIKVLNYKGRLIKQKILDTQLLVVTSETQYATVDYIQWNDARSKTTAILSAQSISLSVQNCLRYAFCEFSCQRKYRDITLSIRSNLFLT